jgi:hypothetical protein
METLRIVRRSSYTLLFLLLAATSLAQTQTADKPFQPQVGQLGKDVVWVPTGTPLVEKMLDMAKVTPQDYVIDLGSGDGRTVIAAARRGAKALGVEYNPDMVALSKKNAAEAGVSGRATFVQADLFATDFSQATVLTMFLLPQINMRLRPTILDMKPGTRVVSNTFTMEDWEPDQTAHIEGECESWCTALFWIVPAKVEGAWKMPQGTLTLSQKFQYLTGTLGSEPISNAKMTGAEIRFTAGGTVYSGRVNGNTMQGTTATGASWTASR